MNFNKRRFPSQNSSSHCCTLEMIPQNFGQCDLELLVLIIICNSAYSCAQKEELSYTHSPPSIICESIPTRKQNIRSGSVSQLANYSLIAKCIANCQILLHGSLQEVTECRGDLWQQTGEYVYQYNSWQPTAEYHLATTCRVICGNWHNRKHITYGIVSKCLP